MLSRLIDSLHNRLGSMALAAFSGVLYFVGFCGFDQFYLTWFCLIPVMWALDDSTLNRKEAVTIAWVFGLVTHLGGYSWITGMLRDFGHLPLPLAVAGYFLLCLAQGTLLTVWGFALHWVTNRLKISFVWSAPVLMVLAEWLWPALFPSYLSNSQYRQITFIQSLDVWGPLGLTFILTQSSAVLYQTLASLIRKRGKVPKLGWAVCVTLVITNFGYGLGATANIDDTVALADRRIKIGIVQVNMGIYEKFDQPGEGLRRHREQSAEVQAQGAELIVWPESGYNYGIPDGVTNVNFVNPPVMTGIHTPVLFGGVRVVGGDGRGTRKPYNAAFLTDADGNVLGTYDKTYLLAFGEYVPLGETFPWLYDTALFRHTSHFYRGTHTRSLVLDDIRYGVLICYEDILPGFVRTVMEDDPQVLVNMTNDAWFGKSREPLIHLALAAFRAVEQRRFLVRSTNTGISAFIDPAGRIVQQTPVFARANLLHDVTPLDVRTIYAIFGDWLAVLCLAILLWWTRHALIAVGTQIVGKKTQTRKR